MATIQQIANRFGKKISLTITIGNASFSGDDIVSYTPGFDAQLLTCCMREAEIELDYGDSDFAESIKGQTVSATLTISEGSDSATRSFEEMIVESATFDEDTRSTTIQAYDKVLYSMKPYEQNTSGITFPISLGNYLRAICGIVGIPVPQTAQQFNNYSVNIESEIFDNTYSYRDILTKIAQAAGGTLAIKGGELRMIYPQSSSSSTLSIDNAISIVDGEHYGPVNVVVLGRSPQEDNVYWPSTIPQNPVEIRIDNNEIVDSNRDAWIQGIYSAVNGLSYDCVEYESFGELCVDILDRFTFYDIAGNSYGGLCLNSFAKISQGLGESFSSVSPDNSVTDYSYASPTDKAVKQVSLRVDKVGGQITSIVSEQEEIKSSVTQTATALEIAVSDIVQNKGSIEATSVALDALSEKYGEEVSAFFQFLATGLRIYAGDKDTATQYLQLAGNVIQFFVNNIPRLSIDSEGVTAPSTFTAEKSFVLKDSSKSFVQFVNNGKFTISKG